MLIVRAHHMGICIHFIDVLWLQSGRRLKIRLAYLPQSKRPLSQSRNDTLALRQRSGKDNSARDQLTILIFIGMDDASINAGVKVIKRLDLAHQCRIPSVAQLFQPVPQGGDSGSASVGAFLYILQDTPKTVKFAILHIGQKLFFKILPIIRVIWRGDQSSLI